MALYRYNGATWRKVKNVYRKTTPESYTGTPASNFTDSSKHWRRHAAFYYKKANGSWARVHTKTSTGVVFTTAPAIHTYGGSSNPYGPNDGISVSSPQTLNTVLYGKDGIWTPRNEISITRNFQASATPDGASRFVIDSNDIFDLSSASSQIQSDADESYLYYRISVTNFGDTTTASAGPLFLIKDYPQWNSFGTGTTAPIVGNTLTFTYNMQNYYYNRIERANSVIEWWRSPTTDAEGTLIKSTLVSDTNITTNNSTSLQGTDTYVLDSADSGYYVVAKMKVVNSWTRYYNDNNYYSSDPTTAKVSGPISFTNTRVEDSQGNSGVDNYFGLPTATSLRFKTTISNVNSSTTYRVRYRYYNFQTSAITSWTTYTANSSGVGDISSVSISSGVATVSDTFTIDSATYNGSTYGGGLARWGVEIEVAAIKSGTTTTDYLIYDIHAAPTPSLSVLPVSGNPPLNVTFSGSISGTPSPYISYPKSYTIDFGDGTTPYTGTFSYGTGNPTFSGISHTYSSTGTYYPTIKTIPYYTIAYSNSVIAATAPDIPIGLSGAGVGNTDLQKISLNWNVANNANTYELFFNGTGTTPSDGFAADYSGITTNSFTTPYASFSANTTYYWWVRSVSSNGLKSSWSARATVTTNSNILTAPTITSVSSGAAGGAVSVYFSGGSGPYYQMYWTTGSAGTGYDESGYSSPITDLSGPSLSGYTWYAYVRSVSSLTNVGTGPSTTISAWSNGYPFTVTAPNASPPAYVNAGVSANVFSVSWPTASNATKYRVYWVNSSSTSADPASSYDGETTGTSIQFTLSYNSSYYFFVSASGDNNVWTPYNSARSSQVTSGSQIVTTYGSCEAYGSAISSTSGYYCDGTYSQNYTDTTYYARRQILTNGSWSGAYDYSGCSTAVVRTLGTSSQVNGQCGYTASTTTYSSCYEYSRSSGSCYCNGNAQSCSGTTYNRRDMYVNGSFITSVYDCANGTWSSYDPYGCYVPPDLTYWKCNADDYADLSNPCGYVGQCLYEGSTYFPAGC